MGGAGPGTSQQGVGGSSASGYPYGSGMDFGRSDLAAAPKPGIFDPPPTGPRGDLGFKAPPVGTGVLPPLAPESANNPNTVGGTTRPPGYGYGVGMDFGRPEIVPGGWTDTTERDLRISDPMNKELQLGGHYYREIDQRGRSSFGFDPTTGLLATPVGGWTNPEEMYLRNYDADNPAFDLGGRYYREPPQAIPGGILAGGYDPGDMGDAITNQQHEYMNAARAAAAKEAAYQEQVRADREAVDASIAAAAAQSNAWNPQYNLQTNFNQNVAGLNPTNIFDRWSSGQSTQYQSY